ncbi:hypothetical protein [Luteimonas kalidii]|uniref:DUF1772 domain-containing protein n=1 Tax=Luteimonas kalidii TaxID=3042025 RepID=A0ABT6JS50_9GAMM|nr:hypothetical protein [Luteimonas kalidii]MDH5833512.1 hypothetical protein [Luteimonas kalidii]
MLMLCLVYAALAIFVLVKATEAYGQIETGWPHHGAFRHWDAFWNIVIPAVSISLFATSVMAATMGSRGRFWLSLSLSAFAFILLVQGPHYSFLDYRLQSGGALPLNVGVRIVFFHLASMGGWLLVPAAALAAHLWFFFYSRPARTFYGRKR